MSKFSIGARVAIISGYSNSRITARSSEVVKVLKNGNVIIKDMPGQQHKIRAGIGYPTGQEGRYRFTHTIQVWDEEFESGRAADLRRKELEERWRKVQDRVRKMKAFDLSEEAITEIENLIAEEKEDERHTASDVAVSDTGPELESDHSVGPREGGSGPSPEDDEAGTD